MRYRIMVTWRDADSWREMQHWLDKNVGKGNWRFEFRGISVSNRNQRYIDLDNEQMAIMFALKWG